jgi:hypothetical protein
LRKELHDDSPSLIPHPKKSKRISLKVKERVTHELKKKKKNTKRDLPPHRHLLVNSVIKVNYKSFYMQFNANLLKCFLLLGLVLVHGTDALMQPKEKDEEKDEV